MKLVKILLIGSIVILILALAGMGYYFLVYKKSSAEPATIPAISSETNTTQDSCPPSVKEKNTPYYHQIYSATSTDGKTWTKIDKMIYDHASVPGAVIKDGIIYLYFVDASGESDQLSVAISKDLGRTFEKHKVENNEMASCDMVDPHPELINGKIRLYYLGNFTKAPQLEQKGELAFMIYSAETEDGFHLSNQKTAYATKEPTTDPDVFKTDQDWRMFVSKGKGLDLLISADNGITFKRQDDFSWNAGGVCDTYNFNGTYRTYFCGQGIQSATGADKGKLTQESGVKVEENGKIACDPSIIQLPDNSYLMYYKTQDTPKQQNPPGPNENPTPPNIVHNQDKE